MTEIDCFDKMLRKEMSRTEFLETCRRLGWGALGLSLAPSLLHGCVTAGGAVTEDTTVPASPVENVMVNYPKLAGQKIQSPEHYGLDGCMVGFFNGGVFVFTDRGPGYLMEKVLDNYGKKGIDPSVMILDYKASRLSEFGRFPKSQAEVVAKRGIIPFVTFDLRNTVDKVDYSLSDILKGKPNKDGLTADHIIKRIAREAKEFGEQYGGFFIRTMREMNGGWYPWGKSRHFQKAWQHIWQIFEDEGANQYSTWIWNPIVNDGGRIHYANSANSYYPGDDYVDWIGMNGFNFGPAAGNRQWNSFKETFKIGYSIMRKKHPSKPIIICETGCYPDEKYKPKWHKDMFNQLKTNFKGIKAIVYYDNDWSSSKDGFDSRIDSSPEALQAFKESIAEPYFLGEVPYRKDL